MMTEEARKQFLQAVRNGEIPKDQAINAFEKLSRELSAHSHREFTPKTHAERVEQLREARAYREHTRKLKIPFITPDFLPGFLLSQGLVLVGGVSGQGKSTVASNILAGFLLATDLQEKQAIVITNEENADAILDRTSCVLLRQSYMDFHKETLDREATETIRQTSEDLASLVEVVDDANWDMTCLEDVISVLEYAAKSDAGIVILDYLQTVTHSKKFPDKEPVQVSKELGFYMKSLGRRCRIPVVTFAQLKPKSESPDIQTRFQNDRTIYNHAFQVIEIIPDFDTFTTTFKIHKDRFGFKTNQEVEMRFQGGRYVMEGKHV